MIEATCSACGTLNRVSEANVPAGAKFVTCAGCKARVALPLLPGPAAGVSTPHDSAPLIELADLPAPKRSHTLSSQPPPPTPRTSPATNPPAHRGLAAALDPELPAPKATRAAGPTRPV